MSRWRWRIRRRWRRLRKQAGPAVYAAVLLVFWLGMTVGFWYVMYRLVRPAFGEIVPQWETTTTTVPVRCGACPAIPRCPDCVLVVPPERCRVIWTHQDRPGWLKQLRLCPAS